MEGRFRRCRDRNDRCPRQFGFEALVSSGDSMPTTHQKVVAVMLAMVGLLASLAMIAASQVRPLQSQVDQACSKPDAQIEPCIKDSIRVAELRKRGLLTGLDVLVGTLLLAGGLLSAPVGLSAGEPSPERRQRGPFVALLLILGVGLLVFASIQGVLTG
jgi:hypothetical protein